MILALLAASPLHAADPIYLSESDPDWQQIIEANPPGSRFIIRSGVHRQRQIFPKNDSIIEGEPGAILNGCVVLSDWKEVEGGLWSHEVSVPFIVMEEKTGVRTESARHSQHLFMGEKRLPRVFDPTYLRGFQGAWYFDREASKVFLSLDPRGQHMELMGSKTCAIGGNPANGSDYGLRVIIRNLVVERYPTQDLQSAISSGPNSTIEDCESRWNHSNGIAVTDGCVARRNWTHHNGLMGMLAASDALIEENELSDNSWGNFTRDYTSGGIKLVGDKSILRRNYSHHNYGPGYWIDIESLDLLIEENIAEWNEWEGILFEISKDGIVRRNVCRYNASPRVRSNNGWGGQICIQNSSHILVESNYLETNSLQGLGNGIVGINQSRGGGPKIPLYYVHHNTIRANTIVSRQAIISGITYGTTGYAGYEGFKEAANLWVGNHYLFGDPSAVRWLWYTEQMRIGDVFPTELTWRQWQSYGQDLGGSVDSAPQDHLHVNSPLSSSLIEKVVGFDPEVLKAKIVKPRDPKDTDGDGLPDWWEVESGTNLTAKDSEQDPDVDGLSNIQEWRNKSSPKLADTDQDGLPDGWEVNYGLPPHIHSSAFDPDEDGLTSWEEFIEHTDPGKSDAAPSVLPRNSVKAWFSSRRGLELEEGRWINLGSLGGRLDFTSTYSKEVSPNGQPASRFQGGFAYGGFKLPVAEDGSFSLAIVFRRLISQRVPENVLHGICSMENYPNAGLRIGVLNDCLYVWSIQDKGTLNLHCHQRLGAEPHLVVITYYGTAQEMQVHIDGQEQVRERGLVVPGANLLTLGAIYGAPGEHTEFQEAAYFSEALRPLQRLALEQYLKEIYFGAKVMERDDRDYDGIPDDYEVANELRPDIPDSGNDYDNDGLTNLEEYRLGSSPKEGDTDGDGVSDGSEAVMGTDPNRPNTFLKDTDGDGAVDADELRDGSDFRQSDPTPDIMPWGKLRSWFRPDQGVIAASGKVREWKSVIGEATLRAPSADLSSNLIVGVEGTTLPIAPLSMPLAYVGPNASGTWLVSAEVEEGDDSAIARLEASNVSVQLRPFPSSGSPPQSPFKGGAVQEPGMVRAVVGYTFDSSGERLSHGGQAPTFSVAKPFPNGPLLFSLGSARSQGPLIRVREILSFEPALTAMERRMVERYLAQTELSNAVDQDSDGIPDWFELRHGTSVSSADSDQDADLDGRTNLRAYQLGMPTFVWVDADGNDIHDQWEASYHLPRGSQREDPDGDGWDNYAEFVFGMNPLVQDQPDVALHRLSDAEFSLDIAMGGLSRHSSVMSLERSLVRNGITWLNGTGRFDPVEIDGSQWRWRMKIVEQSNPFGLFRVRVNPAK